MNLNCSLDSIRRCENLGKPFIIYFHVEWIEACSEFRTVLQRFSDQNLSNRDLKTFLIDIDDEKDQEIVDKFGVEFVPTVIFDDGISRTRINEFDTNQLVSILNSYSENPVQTEDILSADQQSIPKCMFEKLHNLINSSTVMIFIKGSPLSPRCKFTRNLVQLLESRRISFNYFDILQDCDVRKELKIYSNWKTYPQVYIKGEFIGGLKTTQELVENEAWNELFI